MKKIMRKISLFVAISILATMMAVSIGVSAEETGSVLTQNQEGLLRYLNILPEEEPAYSKALTRGELAHLAARVANAPAYTGEELYFYDVPKDHPYFADIYALGAMGVLSGDGNGNFRPEDSVSDLEICKVFSVILGYKDAGEFVSYLRIARDAEITDGITMDGTVTYGEALAMAYNTLHGDMFEIVTYGDTKEYKKNEGYLAVERYHGLVKQSGIVDGMQYTTLIEPSIDIPEGYIRINNRLFRCEDDTLLGKYVVFYSKREGSSTAKEIQYIYADETRNNMVTLNGKDVIGIKNGELHYWVGSDERSYKLLSTRDIIVNGVAHPKATQAELQPESGTVTLIDNNDDNIYDVIVVESFEYAVFELQDKETGVLYTKYPEGTVGSKDIPNDISLIGPYGKVKISSVVAGTVLRIQSSKNTTGIKRIRLTQMEGSVTGQVTAMLKDKITVAGQEFILNGETVMDEPVALGQTVTVYSDGELAGVILHASNDNYQFAYLLGARNAGGAFSGKLSVRIIDKNYILQEFDGADVVFVDEIKYTKPDAVLARLQNASGLRSYHEDVGLGAADANGLNDLGRMRQGDSKFPYSQPVRFKLSDDGKLTHLDTLIYEQDYELADSLQTREPGNSQVRRLAYASYPNSFYDSTGTELIFTAEGMEQVMRIQQIERDETEGFRGTLVDGHYPVVEAYTVDPVTKIAKYLVVYDQVATTTTVSNQPYIVTDIYDTLDEDGNPIRKVNLVHPASSRTVVIPAELQIDLAIGDVIQIEVNGENVLQAVTMMFDQSLGKDQERVVSRGSKSYHTLYYNYRVSYGTLVNFTGTIYTHTTSVKEDNDGVEAYNELHNYKDNKTIIYIYENKNGKPVVKQGSTKDIITYTTDPNTTQKAVTCVKRGGNLEYILLIKEG